MVHTRMGLMPQNCSVPAADVSSRAAFGISGCVGMMSFGVFMLIKCSASLERKHSGCANN